MIAAVDGGLEHELAGSSSSPHSLRLPTYLPLQQGYTDALCSVGGRLPHDQPRLFVILLRALDLRSNIWHTTHGKLCDLKR